MFRISHCKKILYFKSKEDAGRRKCDGSNPFFQITIRLHLLSEYVKRDATLSHVRFIWARSTSIKDGRELGHMNSYFHFVAETL